MDIDLLDPDRFQRGEHHEMFKILRDTDPGIHWHDEPDGPGFWSVTRIDHLREVNRNTDVFSSNAGGTQIVDPPRQLAILPLLQIDLDQLDQRQPLELRRLGRQKLGQRRRRARFPRRQERLDPPGQLVPVVRRGVERNVKRGHS